MFEDEDDMPLWQTATGALMAFCLFCCCSSAFCGDDEVEESNTEASVEVEKVPSTDEETQRPSTAGATFWFHSERKENGDPWDVGGAPDFSGKITVNNETFEVPKQQDKATFGVPLDVQLEPGQVFHIELIEEDALSHDPGFDEKIAIEADGQVWIEKPNAVMAIVPRDAIDGVGGFKMTIIKRENARKLAEARTALEAGEKLKAMKLLGSLAPRSKARKEEVAKLKIDLARILVEEALNEGDLTKAATAIEALNRSDPSQKTVFEALAKKLDGEVSKKLDATCQNKKWAECEAAGELYLSLEERAEEDVARVEKLVKKARLGRLRESGALVRRGKWVEAPEMKLRITKAKTLTKYRNPKQTRWLDNKTLEPEEGHYWVVMDGQMINTENTISYIGKDGDGVEAHLIDMNNADLFADILEMNRNVKFRSPYDLPSYYLRRFVRKTEVLSYEVGTGRRFSFTLFFEVPDHVSKESLVLRTAARTEDGDPIYIDAF